MFEINKIKKKITITIVLYVLIFAILLFSIPRVYRIFPDSKTYINNAIIRTPAYPLLLDLFELIFGSVNYLWYVVKFQIILSFSSVLILSLVLKKHFDFGIITFWVVFFILINPVYSYTSIFSSMNVANNILSESLTYSLFLISITFMIIYIFMLEFKYLVYFFICLAIVSTVRPQFIFLYVIGAMFIIYNFYKMKHLRQTIIAGVLLIVFIVGCSLFARTYNYIVHGHFVKIPLSGIQLIVPQLYTSDTSDIRLFHDTEKNIFLGKIYEKIETKQMTRGGVAGLYAFGMNEIVWKAVVLTYAEQYIGQTLYDLNGFTLAQIIDLDRLTTSIALKLLSANSFNFAIFYIKNISYGMGGNYSFLFFLITLCIFIYLFLKTKKNIFFAFTCISIIHFMNYGLVAILEPVIPRYSFYTNHLQWAFLVIFWEHSIKINTDRT